ncbi:MAG: nuclear transport factor 2 family protein [Chloroflexota bacterium]|nr:nuclear transport factor 2 family protein [Chloroflexota bacterium]
MTLATSQASDEDQIREIIEKRVKAVRTRDIDAAMAGHAPNVLMFDLIDPLRYAGSDTVRERTEAWYASYQGPIGYEVLDVHITSGADVAFCHYLYRVSGTRTDGADIEMWVRSTVCFQKVDGAWIVTHEHGSVPFDPETGLASLDLQP